MRRVVVIWFYGGIVLEMGIKWTRTYGDAKPMLNGIIKQTKRTNHIATLVWFGFSLVQFLQNMSFDRLDFSTNNYFQHHLFFHISELQHHFVHCTNFCSELWHKFNYYRVLYLETKSSPYACLIEALRPHALSSFSQNLPALWKGNSKLYPHVLSQKHCYYFILNTFLPGVLHHFCFCVITLLFFFIIPCNVFLVTRMQT